MDNLQIITLLLIIAGGMIICIPAYYTFKLLNVIRTSKYRAQWKFLLGLMLLFSLSYFVIAGIILSGNQNSIHTITGLIFFFGALFVYLTVWTGKNTIEDLLDTTVSKNYVENIIRSMADTLIVIDADKDSTIKTVNKATVNLLGYKEDELIGTSVGNILDAHLLKEANEVSMYGTDNLRVIETTYKTKLGKEVPVSLSATKLKSIKGETGGIIYVAQDISERKEAERKIEKYVEQLKELNASKDRFFSIIAHDLKNPFAGVLGASELLASDAMEMDRAEIVEFSAGLYKQSKSIYDLLENLLEWSRIQTGKMRYNPANINPDESICKLKEIYGDIAKKKNVQLICNNGKEFKVFADQNMFFTVIRNLTSNAIKFTREGGKVSIISKELDDRFVEVSVEDTGVGIPREVQEKLFKIDSYHTTKGTNDEAGNGLGLILCNELIKQNGGKLSLESEPGKGTTFSFTIPKAE